MTRRRLDAELVRRRLAADLAEAGLAIASGRVRVGGQPATNPGTMVAADTPVAMAREQARFVSRGGQKLDAALENFAVDVAGRSALDVGASTGGFTDCLLQRGATSVVAVDVGYGQLHERLRQDARVVVRDRTHANALGNETFDIVVADLSFISLRSVMAPLLDSTADVGDLIVLVKPQFEATRSEATEGGGVIRSPEIWRRALVDLAAAIAAHRAAMIGAMVSPITGARGNVEFLVHARRDVEPGKREAEAALVERVITAASDT